MKSNCSKILENKKGSSPFSVVTAYDYPTAKIAVEAGIDILLVGDSVGTNVLGYGSEKEVTMSDMVHHLKAVVRGAPQTCIMVDLPFGAADTPQLAAENAALLTQNGADIVKIEGWAEKGATFEHLASLGFSVCGHIGYNPQIHGARASVFGKDLQTARDLVASAKCLERAGATWLVVEKVPEEVCRVITSQVSIPVIGIGSGKYCDGQVLVFHDVVGLSERVFKHARAFANMRTLIKDALVAYRAEVGGYTFPAAEQSAHVPESLVHELENGA